MEEAGVRPLHAETPLCLFPPFFPPPMPECECFINPFLPETPPVGISPILVSDGTGSASSFSFLAGRFSFYFLFSPYPYRLTVGQYSREIGFLTLFPPGPLFFPKLKKRVFPMSPILSLLMCTSMSIVTLAR